VRSLAALTAGKPQKPRRSAQLMGRSVPRGWHWGCCPETPKQEPGAPFLSAPANARLGLQEDFCPRWQNAFRDDIQRAPAKHQHELVVRWQSLGKAELRTHLSREPRNRSGTVGAIRSCLRTVSACGFETSATAKQGRYCTRPSGACGLTHRDGQTESPPGDTLPPLTSPPSH